MDGSNNLITCHFLALLFSQGPFVMMKRLGPRKGDDAYHSISHGTSQADPWAAIFKDYLASALLAKTTI